MQIRSDDDMRVGLTPHWFNTRMSDRSNVGIECMDDSVCKPEQGFSNTVNVGASCDHERRWTCHSLFDVIHCFVKRSSDLTGI